MLATHVQSLNFSNVKVHDVSSTNAANFNSVLTTEVHGELGSVNYVRYS